MSRLTGARTRIAADRRGRRLVVQLDAAPHATRLGVVADALAPLWPGFLAPAAVSLEVEPGDTWDGEAMALRSHRLGRR